MTRQATRRGCYGFTKQRDLIASLYEELVIARGLIKEICTVRSIAEPKSSLQRMDKAIKDAKEYMLENS
ncbi:hypothetical protein AXK17_13530 [Klebsiella pneumoniae]|nr:hypothetical protein AXK17_13530 [Klebsiella pneumoniae]